MLCSSLEISDILNVSAISNLNGTEGCSFRLLMPFTEDTVEYSQISFHRGMSVNFNCSKVQAACNFWMDHMEVPFLQSCNFANV